MKIQTLTVATLTITLLCTACASTEFQTSVAPISASTANQIREGKDTKTDVLAMFGAPNGLATQYSSGGYGYYSGVLQNTKRQEVADDLLLYRDCTVKSAAEIDAGKAALATAASMVTFGLSSLALGSGAKSSTVEECKMLAVMLDDKDIVDARGYVESNLFTEERVRQIYEDSSTKADVIRVMTVPTTVTSSGESVIFTYKNCLTSGSTGFSVIKNTSKQTSVCQQASFVINQANAIVERITFIPFPITK